MEHKWIIILVIAILGAVLLIICLCQGIKMQQTDLVFIQSHIKIQTMQLEAKQFLDTNLGLVDHKTTQPIEATFSNVVLTSSDPEIFTTDTDVDADGVFDVVGVAEGTGTLNVKADVSYTDANTGEPVTVPKEANIDVTVTAPPIEAEETDLVVTFSAPKPVPTPAS